MRNAGTESLGLDEASFDAALDFFHSMSLMFYFRDILPAVVFIDPHVMLDKVSEPIEFMFELQEPEDQDECTSGAPAADNHPPSDSNKQSPHSNVTATEISTLPALSTLAPKRLTSPHSCESHAATQECELLPKKKLTTTQALDVDLLPSGWYEYEASAADNHPSSSPYSSSFYSPPYSSSFSSPTSHSDRTTPFMMTQDDEPLPKKLPTTTQALYVILLPPGWYEFNKFGHITKPFLNDKRFSSHYHTGIFTSDDLIHLLKELLVFAKLSTDEAPDTWFMLSVLRQVPAEKTREVCVSAGPLVVDFPDGGPQNGIFCSLMSHVLSPQNRHPHPWKLCLSSNEPTCLYRNCIQFHIPEYGSVTLMDRYQYFEVHVSTSEEEMQELWQNVQNAIFSGTESVCGVLGYSNYKPRPAIICPTAHTDKAHAAYIKNGKWNCTSDDRVFGKLRDLDTEFPWCKKTGELYSVRTCMYNVHIHVRTLHNYNMYIHCTSTF